MKQHFFRRSTMILFIGMLTCQSFIFSKDLNISEKSSNADGTFLITIFRNGKEVKKLNGEKVAAIGEHSNRVALLFRGGEGNMISLWTTTLKSASGTTSGDYKIIEDFKNVRSREPGQACIVLHLSEDLGGNVIGLNKGTFHLMYQKNKASGNFDASGIINNNSVEVKGTFGNVPVNEK